MKLSSKIITIASSILGVTVAGCGGSECMYGTPNADYEIKGIVTDTENIPLEGIKVSVGDIYGNFDDNTPLPPTLYTSSNGKFEVKYKAFPFSGKKMKLRFSDDNGIYKTKYEEAAIKYTGKSNAWYHGKAIIDVSVKLSKLEK